MTTKLIAMTTHQFAAINEVLKERIEDVEGWLDSGGDDAMEAMWQEEIDTIEDIIATLNT